MIQKKMAAKVTLHLISYPKKLFLKLMHYNDPEINIMLKSTII